MPLGKEQIDHLSRLSRLALLPRDIESLQSDLDCILVYAQQLVVADLPENIVPDGPAPHTEPLRADEVSESLPRHEALRNAPDSDGSFFLVPKVLG